MGSPQVTQTLKATGDPSKPWGPLKAMERPHGTHRAPPVIGTMGTPKPLRGSTGTTRTLQAGGSPKPRGPYKPPGQPTEPRGPQSWDPPPTADVFLNEQHAGHGANEQHGHHGQHDGCGVGGRRLRGQHAVTPWGQHTPKPPRGGRGAPTSCPGLSRVLVHFFFMSVSSLLGLSPPLHLSPGILRYLEQNGGWRGGGEMCCEPPDPPRPSPPRCRIGVVPAGAQQLAAAVEAELQVVALQLGLLHAHRLVLGAVIAEITAGGRGGVQHPMV